MRSSRYQKHTSTEARANDAPPASGDPLLHELTALTLEALSRRWRKAVGRPLPQDLGRSIALRVLAYREQVLQHGDLDLASQRALMAVLRKADAPTHEYTAPTGELTPSTVADSALSESALLPVNAPVVSRRGLSKPLFSQPLLVRPGTVLAREHGGIVHRVMALEEGFAWNGRTFDSLSQVAHAITGTRWNGPRFFGLRAAEKAKSKTKLVKAARREASNFSIARSNSAHRGELPTAHTNAKLGSSSNAKALSCPFSLEPSP